MAKKIKPGLVRIYDLIVLFCFIYESQGFDTEKGSVMEDSRLCWDEVLIGLEFGGFEKSRRVESLIFLGLFLKYTSDSATLSLFYSKTGLNLLITVHA